MTFSDTFFKHHHATTAEIKAVDNAWKEESTKWIRDIEPHVLIELHEKTVKLYKRLVRLECLWSFYDKCYIHAESERERRDIVADSFHELEKILEETK